jgi:hypothetical protein
MLRRSAPAFTNTAGDWLSGLSHTKMLLGPGLRFIDELTKESRLLRLQSPCVLVLVFPRCHATLPDYCIQVSRNLQKLNTGLAGLGRRPPCGWSVGSLVFGNLVFAQSVKRMLAVQCSSSRNTRALLENPHPYHLSIGCKDSPCEATVSRNTYRLRHGASLLHKRSSRLSKPAIFTAVPATSTTFPVELVTFQRNQP